MAAVPNPRPGTPRAPGTKGCCPRPHSWEPRSARGNKAATRRRCAACRGERPRTRRLGRSAGPADSGGLGPVHPAPEPSPLRAADAALGGRPALVSSPPLAHSFQSGTAARGERSAPPRAATPEAAARPRLSALDPGRLRLSGRGDPVPSSEIDRCPSQRRPGTVASAPEPEVVLRARLPEHPEAKQWGGGERGSAVPAAPSGGGRPVQPPR